MKLIVSGLFSIENKSGKKSGKKFGKICRVCRVDVAAGEGFGGQITPKKRWVKRGGRW